MIDLIDRNELIKDVCNRPVGNIVEEIMFIKACISEAPTITVPKWISVEDRLPTIEDCEGDHSFAFVNVTVCDSGISWPMYGACEDLYERIFVTSASFDTKQKIWDVCGCQLNALIPQEDAPKGMFVTHWMPMPNPPKEET